MLQKQSKTDASRNGQDNVQYGQIPYAMADAGRYKGLTHAESLIMLLITAHTNNKFEARPSVPRLAEMSGFNERSVRRAITGLEQKGLLSTSGRRGGRNLATTYRLVVNPDPGVRVSLPKPGPGSPPFDEKPGPLAPETRTVGALNPDSRVPLTTLNNVEQQQQVPASPPAAAAGEGKEDDNDNGGRDEITGNGRATAGNNNDRTTADRDPDFDERRRILSRLRFKDGPVGEPSLSRLANMPIPVAEIPGFAKLKQKKPAGAFVNDVPSLIPDPEEVERRAYDQRVLVALKSMSRAAQAVSQCQRADKPVTYKTVFDWMHAQDPNFTRAMYDEAEAERDATLERFRQAELDRTLDGRHERVSA